MVFAANLRDCFRLKKKGACRRALPLHAWCWCWRWQSMEQLSVHACVPYTTTDAKGEGGGTVRAHQNKTHLSTLPTSHIFFLPSFSLLLSLPSFYTFHSSFSSSLSFLTSLFSFFEHFPKVCLGMGQTTSPPFSQP